MPQSYSTAQKLLPLLLDSLEDYAIFMMDKQGLIVTWTPGVLRLLGYEEGEFLGQDAALIFTQQDRESGSPHAELRAAEREGRAADVRWHRRKDGSLFWANGQMIALRDDDGQLRGFAKILRDETRHKEVEDALRETRERLQTALDVGRIGTWEWDIQHDRVVADANLARFFGVSPAEAAGSPIERYTQAIHPDDLPRVAWTIDQSVQSCGAFIADYRIPQPGGEVLWVEARGQVDPNTLGQAAFLNGVVLDITERKRAEAAFRQSEERYRTLFEAIDSGFCVLEMIFDGQDRPVDYHFIEINPAFERQTGLRDAVGKTALELVPELNDQWFQIYGRVALTGESIHFQESADAMGRVFDVHAFRVGVPEARRIALLFSNVTERKRGEDALRQAHAKAEETNRMKDEFLATLSHELRTPLNAILGWANILRLHQVDATMQQQGLETIERNARTQAQLINDLLDVSRILTGKLRLELRPIELADVVESAIHTVTPAIATKGIHLETAIDRSTGLISGDSGRLSQVFWNLLSNAIKFTPRDGSIRVSMWRTGSQVQVQIRDSGRGIAPDFLPFVFERFRQADASSTRAHGGLGIGLALVRHLMEAHGGTVSAQSEGENRGSTFTIAFPLSAIRPEVEQPTEALVSPQVVNGMGLSGLESSVPIPALSGLRILVVDDEADARELVKLALTQRGSQVDVAEDAATAFALVQQGRQNQRPFDVLVSDVGMPNEDGHSLMRRIRGLEEKEGGFLPAIALTAYANHKDRVNALLAGFQVHIAKPVEPLELVATVASLKGRTGHTG